MEKLVLQAEPLARHSKLPKLTWDEGYGVAAAR
jgi:hypothetical protein